MANVRLSKALCTVVGEVLASTESHATLDALFRSAGAPGDAPALPHHSKWKEWLFRAGRDPEVDSLAVLGNVLEEFMDVPPKAGSPSHGLLDQREAGIPQGVFVPPALNYQVDDDEQWNKQQQPKHFSP